MTLIPNAALRYKMVCAACRQPIDPQPGQSYRGSTDGKVWHIGCYTAEHRRTLEEVISAWAFAHNIDGAARNELFKRIRDAQLT